MYNHTCKKYSTLAYKVDLDRHFERSRKSTEFEVLINSSISGNAEFPCRSLLWKDVVRKYVNVAFQRCKLILPLFFIEV